MGSQASTIIFEHLQALTAICERHDVARLSVFGSVSRNDFDLERSDLDFFVEFKPLPASQYAVNYFDFVRALEQLFVFPVDVISGSIINPFVRGSVERDRRVVYAAA